MSPRTVRPLRAVLESARRAEALAAFERANQANERATRQATAWVGVACLLAAITIAAVVLS